jgi:hypothetical protein
MPANDAEPLGIPFANSSFVKPAEIDQKIGHVQAMAESSAVREIRRPSETVRVVLTFSIRYAFPSCPSLVTNTALGAQDSSADGVSVTRPGGNSEFTR